jgi:hypothetical protein
MSVGVMKDCKVSRVYHETIKRDRNTRLINECRCVRRSELCVRGKLVCHLSRLHSLSFIKISCYVCMKLSVEKRTTQVSGYFVNIECQ